MKTNEADEARKAQLVELKQDSIQDIFDDLLVDVNDYDVDDIDTLLKLF